MSPSITTQYFIKVANAGTQLIGGLDLFSLTPQIGYQNLPDRLIGEIRHTMVFPRPLAALLHHIVHVVLLRTEKQMFDIAARGVVPTWAIMKCLISLGYRSVRDLPCNSVSTKHGRAKTSPRDTSITRFSFGAGPKETAVLVRLRKSSIQSYRNRNHLRGCYAWSRAKPAPSSFNIARLSLKGLGAVFADAWYAWSGHELILLNAVINLWFRLVGRYQRPVGNFILTWRLDKKVEMAETSVHLVDPVTGDELLAEATLANCFMVIAAQIFTIDIEVADVQHSLAEKEPYVLNAQSYAIGLHMITGATAGQIHDLMVRGNPKTGSSLKTT